MTINANEKTVLSTKKKELVSTCTHHIDQVVHDHPGQKYYLVKLNEIIHYDDTEWVLKYLGREYSTEGDWDVVTGIVIQGQGAALYLSRYSGIDRNEDFFFVNSYKIHYDRDRIWESSAKKMERVLLGAFALLVLVLAIHFLKN